MKFKTTTLAMLLYATLARAATFEAALDPSSVPGQISGTLQFSFSTTNPADYNPATGYWVVQDFDETFNVGNITINLDFLLMNEDQHAFNLVTMFEATDPALGSLYNGLGNGNNTRDYEDADYISGKENPINYGVKEFNSYVQWDLDEQFTDVFGYTLHGDFDGTNGTASGMWFLDYQAAPTYSPGLDIAATPEPSSWLLGAIGALALVRWKKTRSCR